MGARERWQCFANHQPRKVLRYAWKNCIAFERSAIYGIDADLHFDAAVDAVLLVSEFRLGANEQLARVYGGLHSTLEHQLIGYEDETLLGDVAAYHRWKHLCGDSALKWRSGIKHDCAQVMELRPEGDKYRNGLDEVVDLEEAFLYPMMKSSDIANGRIESRHRVMLVTQSKVGDDTGRIEKDAPKTWAYLEMHGERFKKRGSLIYRDRPKYSVFGVGGYSFAPWKVAISGFYKSLRFFAVGPIGGKPVVLDDTSYFLPCETEEQANFLAVLLNSSAAQEFYRAFVFWDNKRPITVELLQRLDLLRGDTRTAKPATGGRRKPIEAQLELWRE